MKSQQSSRTAVARSSAWSDQLQDAVEYGGALGYALARCWPDSIEGLADWPDRAEELAATIQRRTSPAKYAPDAA